VEEKNLPLWLFPSRWTSVDWGLDAKVLMEDTYSQNFHRIGGKTSWEFHPLKMKKHEHSFSFVNYTRIKILTCREKPLASLEHLSGIGEATAFITITRKAIKWFFRQEMKRKITTSKSPKVHIRKFAMYLPLDLASYLSFEQEDS